MLHTHVSRCDQGAMTMTIVTSGAAFGSLLIIGGGGGCVSVDGGETMKIMCEMGQTSSTDCRRLISIYKGDLKTSPLMKLGGGVCGCVSFSLWWW